VDWGGDNLTLWWGQGGEKYSGGRDGVGMGTAVQFVTLLKQNVLRGCRLA